MFVFIDESWQKINGTDVAALGGVAIPSGAYNKLCTTFFSMKHNVLGAEELSDTEIKANVNLAPAGFRREAETGYSKRLDAAMQTLEMIRQYRATTFAIWTTESEHLKLRNENSTTLARPYAEMLFDLKRMMKQRCPKKKALLFFDQRGNAEDLAMASAVQNFLMRTDYSWRKHFLQVPHFTRSPVSPGLQIADLIAYLAGQRVDPNNRPELAPFWEAVERRQFAYNGDDSRPALRLVA